MDYPSGSDSRSAHLGSYHPGHCSTYCLYHGEWTYNVQNWKNKDLFMCSKTGNDDIQQ